MVFTTVKYLIFFSIIFLIYYLVPKKKQWIVLLFANIYFYLCACTSVWYILFVICASFITYYGALQLEKIENQKNTYIKENKETLSKDEKKIYKANIDKKKKKILAISIILTLGILVIMKYTGFIFENIKSIINKFNSNFNFISLDFLLPLGISFYTFMSLGYLIDIYRNEYDAEKNFFKYFLYITYFPHILQGPIDKYKELSEQLSTEKNFDYTNSVKSLYRIVLGVFKKVVVADNLAIVISTVTSNLEQYYGINIFITIVLYAIQLYADFSGYMDIAIGCSNMLGIKITENFEAPYFSKSIAEYWRRWHMSLGSWFRDYLYYPLLRCNISEKIRKYFKNKEKKYLSNIMPTVFSMLVFWTLIGVWHGATWAYILYGIYHGSIMIISTILTPVYNKFYEKFPKLIKSKFYSWFQITRTFLLVVVGYFLFSVGDLGKSIQMLKNMFLLSKESLTIRSLTTKECKISILMGIFIIFIFDWCLLKNIDIYERFRKIPSLIRWMIYILGIVIITLFSSGNAQEFIYFQF